MVCAAPHGASVGAVRSARYAALNLAKLPLLVRSRAVVCAAAYRVSRGCSSARSRSTVGSGPTQPMRDGGAPGARDMLVAAELNMAVGWAQDGAVQDQIDATVESEVGRARSRLARGESLAACEDCGEPIPEARRRAVPGVRRCVQCQVEVDQLETAHSLYNRRGNKDSQLR